MTKTSKKPTPLNLQQAKFALAYITNGQNATQAAIEAGYSPKTAHVQGNRLLKMAKVKALVDSALAELLKPFELNAERVLLELGRLATSRINKVSSWGPNGLKLIPSDEIDDDTMAAISEVKQTKDGEVVVKMHGKGGPLLTLAKLYGLDSLGDEDGDFEQDEEGLGALEDALGDAE